MAERVLDCLRCIMAGAINLDIYTQRINHKATYHIDRWLYISIVVPSTSPHSQRYDDVRPQWQRNAS